MSCYLAIFWSYFSLPRTMSTVFTNVVLSPYFIPSPQSVFYTDRFRNIARGIYAKYQSLQNMPLPIQSFLKKIAKTLDNGKVYSRMWHWGISVKTMLSVRSFLRRGLFVSWGDWGGKKESARPTSPRGYHFLIMDTKREPLWMREVSATIGARK